MSNLSAANSNTLSCVDGACNVAATTNLGTITTASSDLTINGNSWLTANPSYIGTGSNTTYGYGYVNTADNWGSLTLNPEPEKAFSYLTDDELKDFIGKIIERSDDDGVYIRNFISRIVRHRHFSEDFLMEYLEYLTVDDMLPMHSSDIRSKQYTQIALYIEGLK